MKAKSQTARSLRYLVLALIFPLTAVAGERTIGAVYTMTNAFEGNEVLVFNRDRRGELTPVGAFDTEGLGTSAGLGNQGAVILDPANRWLFAVNPGSNDVSVFAVEDDGLTLVDKAPSNGLQPISLTYAHNLLYVLNAGGAVGGSDAISGFTVDEDGTLTPIPGSTLPLSADATGPAQIQFNSDGDVLVVTEKGTDLIDTYTVDSAGIPTGPNVQVSSGVTPFGFAFGKRDELFVSEAAGGAQGLSSVSSYALDDSGLLSVIDPSVGTTETAACWVVVSNDGRYAYTTNAGSDTVSGYEIGFDGSLKLIDRNGRTGRTGRGSAPIDMSLSNDGRNLYTLNSGNSSISVFRVKRDGDLQRMHALWDLPVTANGLAAR
ncbi:MAG: beta-propeller fold lactonase family protein [Candidatus Thiodiazotropha sp.]